jgi:hypothetical protein
MYSNDTGHVRVSFSLNDQYGNETKLEKYVEENYCGMTEFNAMLELFREFLYAAGYSFVHDGTIVWKEDKD